MLRSLFALTALLTGLGTDAFAAGTLAEAIPVPGGTVALARAIGLETPPDPSRFVAELARLAFSRPQLRLDDPATTLTRLTEHLDAAVRFRSALDALPDGGVTLALASREKDGRGQLEAVLELVNLRLKESRGTYSVETGNDRQAAARVERLSALGVDLQRLESRLNAGESVQLKLPTELVPIPLTAAWWSDAVFHRPVAAPDLFAAIFSDSGTALLCHGLAALDDETLTYVADHPGLLERLTGNEAPAFATFASNLHVRNGRVVTPGEASGPLWESVVEEKIDDPESFILALLSRDNGHLAYLYDLVAELDAPRGAFALGLWLQDDRVRIDRFKALASTVHSTSTEWQVRDMPFIRPIDDIGWMLLNMTVEPNGAPRGPVSTELWSRVFESLELPDEAAARRAFARVEKNGTIDAAWLANAVLSGDAQQRGQRLQQLAFGLRAFSAARRDAFGDVLTAVRALPTYTALMLTLERMGITDPAVHAAAARRAQQLSDLEGSAAFMALSQFQGAMALISRMSAAGSLEPARAIALVSSLAAIALKDDRYGSLVVEWLRSELLPAIVPRNDAEASVLAALAGRTARTDGGTGRVSWEGEQYRLDLPAAEERRLVGLRRQQRAYSVDTALALEEVARSLAIEAIDLAAIQRAVGILRALLPALRPSATMARALRPEGVESLPDAAAVVDQVLRDLSKITKPNDAKKATRLAEPLRDLSGAILGEAMSSIAYALDLGGASESAQLGVDLSRRHDFGLALKAKAARRREAWAIPRQMVVTGMPRRVSGSLLGLDVAFARSMLRRVVLEDAESPPVILSNDRETFTRSVALLNPYSMRDADRDAITEAVSRGRARIDAVVAGSGQGDTLDTIAGEIKLDGWRRRAAQWDLAHEPRRLPSLFSLTELLVLGAGERFDGWGMSGTPVSGCLCTRFAAPNEWRLVGGRPQIGSLSTAVADLNLHVATMLSGLRLPAPLARMILGAAMQEFVDRVRPNDANDWLTLVRGASLVSRERIEDYVAAATADGPLLPERNYRVPQP